MRRFLTLLSSFLALSISVTVQTAVAHDPEEIPGVVDRVIDSVVNITTVRAADAKKDIPGPKVSEGSPYDKLFRDFFDSPQREEGKKGEEGKDGPKRVKTIGSGFVIDPTGLIVTNEHIIKDATEISVSFNDGRKLQVEKIIGRDPKTDLVILRVNPGKPLVAVTFGDSSRVRVGQVIIAIGSPFGLSGSVTSGIVSALNRDIHHGSYDNYIQIDAAINKGNAGGPLFNLKDKVIGINTAILSPSGGSTGVGFAVPSNTVMAVIEQLKKYGEIRRGWLGVRIQVVTDKIAASLNMKKPTGALVASVTLGSPAQKGGIKAGDVILTFDGKEIPEMRALPLLAANTELGKRVDIQVLRKGERRMLKVRIERLPENPTPAATGGKTEDAQKSFSLLGLTIQRLTNTVKASHGIRADVSGVFIITVKPGSGAAEKNLKAGEVIVEVRQEAIKTPAEFLEKVGAAKEAGRKSVLLLINDGKGKNRYAALPLAGFSVAPAAKRGGGADPGLGELEALEKLE